MHSVISEKFLSVRVAWKLVGRIVEIFHLSSILGFFFVFMRRMLII